MLESQKEVYSELLSRISQKEGIIFLEGAPGSGKTIILKELCNNSKAAFLDNSLRDKLKNNTLQSLLAEADKGLSSISKIKDLYILLKLFFSFSSTYSQKRKLKKAIGDEDYSLLLRLVNKIKTSKNKVVIADEVNFWDDKDQLFLKTILLNTEVKEVFPILNKISLVISFSANYSKSQHLNEILRTKANTDTTVDLPNCTIRELSFILRELGLPSELIRNNLNDIFKLSLGANLQLVKGIVEYLKVNTFISYSQVGKDEIINKYFYKAPILKKILNAASILKDQFLFEEILVLSNKLYHLSEDEIREKVYEIAKRKFFIPNNLDILISKKQKIQLIHKEFCDYFRPKSDHEVRKYYLKYCEVLSLIAPGDYVERSDIYEKCGDNYNRDIYYAMQCIQLFIKSEFSELSLPNNMDYNLKEFILLMQDAYRSLYNNQESSARSIIDRMCTLNLPEQLKFESDYILYRSKMLSADLMDFTETEERMEYWLKNTNLKSEKEIHTRAYFLIYLIAVYKGDNLKALDVERKILNTADSLSKNSEQYDFYKYSLYRRALMLHLPTTAISNSLASLSFFEKLKDENIFYLKEFFFSLVNHSDNCRYLSKYEDAFKYIEKALQLYSDNSSSLPWVTLANNYAIIGTEANKLLPEEALNKYLLPLLNIDETITYDNTYTILLNNAACLTAKQGNLIKSLEIIKRGLVVLTNSAKNIDNHVYMIKSNLAVIYYLMGKVNKSIKTMNEIKGLYTYKHSVDQHRKRHSILTKTFKEKRFNNVKSLNEYLTHKYNMENTVDKTWNHYNQPLLLWGMQYWSK